MGKKVQVNQKNRRTQFPVNQARGHPLKNRAGGRVVSIYSSITK
jgi:hypothetical protein